MFLIYEKDFQDNLKNEIKQRIDISPKNNSASKVEFYQSYKFTLLFVVILIILLVILILIKKIP